MVAHDFPFPFVIRDFRFPRPASPSKDNHVIVVINVAPLNVNSGRGWNKDIPRQVADVVCGLSLPISIFEHFWMEQWKNSESQNSSISVSIFEGNEAVNCSFEALKAEGGSWMAAVPAVGGVDTI
jgi:hypothetical protein